MLVDGAGARGFGRRRFGRNASMISLVLVFCLSTVPADCQEVRPVLEQDLSPKACVLEGQQLAQDWLVDHPKWALSGWRCERPGGRHEPA
jgi:hypothetical protein